MPDEPFKLGTTELVQLLADPDFYQENIAFLFLRENALKTTKRFTDAVLNKKKGCDGCDRNIDPAAYLEGLFSMFVRVLSQLAELPDQSPVDNLRQYIGKKLGYTPTRIRLYYATNKDSDRKFIEF